MGTINQGILGGFSGKVGTVIGGSWKGISYMRGIATSVSNPQTVPQLTQRERFAVTMSFLQPLSGFLKTGFKEYARKMSGINAAMSYNVRYAVTGAFGSFTTDYPNALISRGPLSPSLNGLAASTVPGEVSFTWDDNSGEAAAYPTDKALLVVYNPVKHQAIVAPQTTTRLTKAQVVTVPVSFSGDSIHAYMAFISADDKEVSSSSYAGEIPVA